MRIFIISLLISMLSIFQPVLGESEEVLRGQLEALLSDIKALRKNIESDQSGYQKLQKSRSKLEKNLQSLNRQIEAQHQKLVQLQQLEAEKADELVLVESEIANHREQYIHQVKAAHRMVGQHRLKLLLSSNRPGEVMRDSVIYEYIHNHRVAAIEKSRALMTRYQQQVQELQARRAEIETLSGNLVEDRELQKIAVAEQLAMMKHLETNIRNQELTLQTKNKKASQLNEILQELSLSGAENLSGLPKGQLAWPVNGELLHDFATAKNTDAATKWNGVAIVAPKGTVFSAIANGSVVFSDWIRGLGIVVIVDHGQSYLSLYAHAQSVYMKVGDSVSQGQELGTVGDTGNAAETMLYFEIRKNGKPVNPRQWCVRPKLAVARR